MKGVAKPEENLTTVAKAKKEEGIKRFDPYWSQKMMKHYALF